MKNPSSPRKLNIHDFINSPKVLQNLSKLREVYNDQTPLKVSDTLDAEGHQYVNLVQKGGGVLGVALVGYTYVLEQMGIRFLKLAGTSAGAINTAMMTVIGNKQDEKSTVVLDAITKLNFFDLVDGHRTARWLIRRFITHKNYFKRIKILVIIIVALFFLLLLGSFLSLLLGRENDSWVKASNIIIFILAVFVILGAELGRYVYNLLRKFKNSGYGINPGKFFYDWIEKQMADNGVNSVEDLTNKAAREPPGLHLREAHSEGLDGLKGTVTFITSELVTQNKVEFPKMSELFRSKDGREPHPAGFVRASMSIPLFFESYFIENIDCDREEIRSLWLETFNEPDPPSVARFVDGGILSNFPISIFYNSKVTVPRLPTFGIDLNDAEPEDNSKSAASWTIQGYFGRIFNTIRNYYDKDFQLKNKVYSQGIGSIPLSEFNWLNFFLTDQEKLAMFEKGAQAATDFLLTFDWEKYKNERQSLQETIVEAVT